MDNRLTAKQINRITQAIQEQILRQNRRNKPWTSDPGSAKIPVMHTPAAHAVITQAETEARNLGHHYIGATHLVLALAAKGHLKGQADYAKLRSGVIRHTGGGYGHTTEGNLSYTPRVRKILGLAADAAQGGDVQPGHITAGLVDHGSSIGAQVLAENASLTQVKQAARQSLTSAVPVAVTRPPQLDRIEQKLDRLHGHLGLK